MPPEDEGKTLVRKFSDKSRKATRTGNKFLIPHKFTPDGDVIDESNFNARRDISRLTLDDFRLLSALQEKKWDLKAACESLQIDLEAAAKRYKKLSYFEFEDKKAHALAAVATPAFVTSKNVEGFFADNLSDGQRDHLKELAKITGAYKPTTNINLNHNVVQISVLSPDEQKRLKEIGDNWQEAQVVA